VAKAPKAAAEAPKAKGGISIVAVLIATVISGAAGSFFGMQVPGLLDAGHGGGEKKAPVVQEEGKVIDLRMLAPITTNLASPPNTWIRLETAALVKGELGPEAGTVLAKLAEDIIAYLRTVPLEQIEGPAGFQHLREDLNERVRIRSEGKITELMIQALVVE
jgi:flagellar protein FliL